MDIGFIAMAVKFQNWHDTLKSQTQGWLRNVHDLRYIVRPSLDERTHFIYLFIYLLKHIYTG